MPQDSYPYAVTRVRAREAKLLDKQKLDRIINALSAADALKALADLGYGDAEPTSSPYDYERLISGELGETYRFIEQITPDERFTDMFFYQYDFHNAKVLKKMGLMGLEYDKDSGDTSILMECGTVPIKEIAAAIANKEYAQLPEQMGKAFMELDSIELAASLTPGQVDIALDKALFELLAQKKQSLKNDFINEYFTAKADLTNIKTYIRSKLIGLNSADMGNMLIEGGGIEKNIFVSEYEQPLSNITGVFGAHNYGVCLERCISGESCSIADYERLMDEYLLNIVKKDRNNSFSIDPIIGYLLAKEQEARHIRIIMTGKINNIDSGLVIERLSELYA